MEIQNEQAQTQTQHQAPALPPSNHLAGAIIVTILCCWPFGIPAIVNAAKVNNLWYSGHQTEAIIASNNAKKWMIVSLILGLLCWLIWVVWLVLVGVGVGVAAESFLEAGGL